MTTGRFAMGAFKLLLQNWLLSAVNSKGAVSPLMRATASNSPVTMPLRAAGYRILTVVRHGYAPIAADESFIPAGTRLSMSSVVRNVIGIAITAKESAPASAEKCPMRTTMIS